MRLSMQARALTMLSGDPQSLTASSPQSSTWSVVSFPALHAVPEPMKTTHSAKKVVRFIICVSPCGHIQESTPSCRQLYHCARVGACTRNKPAIKVSNAPVLGGIPAAELYRLTSKIPIVFTQVSGPVGNGVVVGIARPGGNITGFQTFEPAIGGSWLGVLKEAAPNLSRAVVLFVSDAAANIAGSRIS